MHALVGPLLEGDPDRESARLARGIYRPGGEDNYLRARDPGQYAQYAVRLAGDAALRQRVGQAGREFIERFLADKARAARMYADHFDAILAERRAAKAS
jgi:hypothetical protein